MSDPAPYNLPDLRRVVTGNNERAEGIVTHNSMAPAQAMTIAKGARGTTLWVTTDGLPTNDNNSTCVRLGGFFLRLESSWVLNQWNAAKTAHNGHCLTTTLWG